MVVRNSMIADDSSGPHGVPQLPPTAPLSPDDSPSRRGQRGIPAWLLPSGVAFLIIVWTVSILIAGQPRFAIVAPRGQAGVEAATGLARLFAAVVLFLVPGRSTQSRSRWIAAGLIVLGVGDLAFGNVQPVFVSPGVDESIYASLAIRILASALFVLGLAPRSPPSFSVRPVLSIALLCTAIVGIIVAVAGQLPPLTRVGSLQAAAAAHNSTLLPGLTGWYWFLSTFALALTVVALIGAVHNLSGQTTGEWLLVAMVLLVGSQLHNMFWPSAYSAVLTTGDLLRLAFAAVVVLGGVFELHRIASERTALLATEQERSRNLEELSVLKANFTAMVAHELGSPIAAIRGWNDMLATGDLSPPEEYEAIRTVQKQADILSALVEDVRSAATIERDDFAVLPHPVPLRTLLADATAFAKSLPGEHAIVTPFASNELVWADPDRIGQVLRNLLSNASKYSEPGTPIEIQLTPIGRTMRVQVIDHGFGIDPDDLQRIFEKFGRGRDQSGRRAPGVGLGLYLSRRIVQLHGSELTVESEPGVGSTFGFDLEIVL
jgi:signal transduction histidine kinase